MRTCHVLLRFRPEIAVNDRPGPYARVDVVADLVFVLQSQNPVRRHIAHLFEIGGAQTFLDFQPGLLRVAPVRGRRPPAAMLHVDDIIAALNSPLDKGLCICALTDPAPADWPVISHMRGIAAEPGDVVVNPFQRGVLVEISRSRRNGHPVPSSARDGP